MAASRFLFNSSPELMAQGFHIPVVFSKTNYGQTWHKASLSKAIH